MNLIKIFIIVSAFMHMGIVQAQEPGDRAQKFRGTWWSGLHPTLLDDRMLSLKTLDGFGVGFTSGASQSALHYAPVPSLIGLAGADEVFPANNDTFVLDQLEKVTGAGFMVQAYTNSENFIGTNADQFVEFSESWKNWCDTNNEARTFLASQSYHTKTGFPDRKYMFCYAEFILKYYSQQYGQYIDIWIFDSAKEMENQGDDASSGNVDDQRIYEAYANAARAGNDEIAVSFNNGRSTVNYNSYPYAAATRFDDFTFGHAFGGNNNHAEKVNGNQFNLNYQHITRMTETNGYVHDGGNWTWDDNIVGHFNSKLSTTAWNFGPNQAWEQDDFNQWHEEALSAGGMMTWSGSNNRGLTFYYDWVYDLLKATDDYLYARGISINGESTPVVNTFTPDTNKTYYIDNPKHDLRLSASGSSEEPTTTSTSNTGEDVQWKFVSNGNGEWHIDRAAGGSLPRLRTDSTEFADMQSTAFDDSWESFVFTGGSVNNTHFITSQSGPSNFNRLQVEPNGNVNMVPSSSNGSWESFEITEAESLNGGGSTVVQITKRNATGFAVDGGNGAAAEQEVYLWSSDSNNENQQWIEISQGDDYFSYQKQGTDYCIDGGNNGEIGQGVYLWTCGENNQNQHWKKVSVGSGYYRLEKRNAPDFSINGGNAGSNGQTINLWDSANNSQNLHWGFTPINN